MNNATENEIKANQINMRLSLEVLKYLIETLENSVPKSVLEDIRTKIDNQHTNTGGKNNEDDFIYGKHQAYGNCLDIIDTSLGGIK